MQRRDILAGGAAAVLLVAGRAAGADASAATAMDADDSPAPPVAHRIERGSRLLFISGQVPTDADGDTPERFSAQCRLAWRNLEAQLAAADMQLRHLVKVTVFLARRQDLRRERELRRERLLGVARPSVSVVIVGIYDEGWRIEIEAIALA
ncbi:RidA family protein [Pseudomonas sp. CGJS7]|uniref:RidA family protein n=1 Tax=Pseudomonas sp. CGJS7 TaxID=3109348 RepID=UPI00300A5499